MSEIEQVPLFQGKFTIGFFFKSLPSKLFVIYYNRLLRSILIVDSQCLPLSLSLPLSVHCTLNIRSKQKNLKLN